MSENNKKQAMLPSTAVILDYPIGTACGFALDIGKAGFFFTRRTALSAAHARKTDHPAPIGARRDPGLIHLKRFHPYGLGKSHVDQLLTGFEDRVPNGSVKLGFRTHNSQIETKLTVRGADTDEIQRKLAPVEAADRAQPDSAWARKGKLSSIR